MPYSNSLVLRLRTLLPTICLCLACGDGVEPAPVDAGVSTAAPVSTAALLERLAARRLVAIADGDFVAESYATGQLAPDDDRYRDRLIVLRAGRAAPGVAASLEVEVSNSVVSAPEVLALSPDGRYAFVTERFGPRPPGATLVQELPPGRRLFAVELGDDRAAVADMVDIAPAPEALAVSPDGSRVAVVCNDAGGSTLQIVGFMEGRFGVSEQVDLGALSLLPEPQAGGPMLVTNVQWHPSGSIIAVHVTTHDRVAFLRLSQGERPQPWGAPVDVGKDPFVGRFAPDGRHYFTSNWGRDLTASDPSQRIPTVAGSVSVIRLAGVDAPADAVRHDEVARVTSDVSPEGIAIGPAGRLLATVNMRGTAYPAGTPRHERLASVSFFEFDPEQGVLRKLQDTPFEGVLPEGGTFDATGEHFLATVFQGHAGSDARTGPGLQVFQVVREPRLGLRALGRIALPPGVHHVAVAP